VTLEEAIGIRNANEDVQTGERVEHSEIYGRAIEFLGGLDVVARYIPYPLDVLQRCTKRDPHLNNTSMREWDAMAGFRTVLNTGICDFIGGGLWELYRKHGINAASCSNGVCILKEAARRLVAREEARQNEA